MPLQLFCCSKMMPKFSATWRVRSRLGSLDGAEASLHEEIDQRLACSWQSELHLQESSRHVENSDVLSQLSLEQMSVQGSFACVMTKNYREYLIEDGL